MVPLYLKIFNQPNSTAHRPSISPNTISIHSVYFHWPSPARIGLPIEHYYVSTISLHAFGWHIFPWPCTPDALDSPVYPTGDSTHQHRRSSPVGKIPRQVRIVVANRRHRLSFPVECDASSPPPRNICMWPLDFQQNTSKQCNRVRWQNHLPSTLSYSSPIAELFWFFVEKLDALSRFHGTHRSIHGRANHVFQFLEVEFGGMRRHISGHVPTRTILKTNIFPSNLAMFGECLMKREMEQNLVFVRNNTIWHISPLSKRYLHSIKFVKTKNRC